MSSPPGVAFSGGSAITRLRPCCVVGVTVRRAARPPGPGNGERRGASAVRGAGGAVCAALLAARGRDPAGDRAVAPAAPGTWGGCALPRRKPAAGLCCAVLRTGASVVSVKQPENERFPAAPAPRSAGTEGLPVTPSRVRPLLRSRRQRSRGSSLQLHRPGLRGWDGGSGGEAGEGDGRQGCRSSSCRCKV